MRGLATIFIVLTLLDGEKVDVNPSDIVTMRPSGDQMHPDANCILTLLDGKFLSVVEDCVTVRAMTGEGKP
jgi:hypothetical protein